MFEEDEVSIEALDDTAKDESINFYLELRENFNEFYGESEEIDVFMYQHLFDYLGFFEEELEHYFNGVTLNPNFVFDTREEAEYNSLYFRTYLLMKSWIKHHYPSWNPDWTIKERKYGIAYVKNLLLVDYNWYANDFLFGLTVPTKEAAELLYKEFESDLASLFIE